MADFADLAKIRETMFLRNLTKFAIHTIKSRNLTKFETHQIKFPGKLYQNYCWYNRHKKTHFDTNNEQRRSLMMFVTDILYLSLLSILIYPVLELNDDFVNPVKK